MTTEDVEEVCATETLARRMEAEIAAARAMVREFQDDAKRSYQAMHERYRMFLHAAHHVRKLVQERLEVLARKFAFTPSLMMQRSRRRLHGTVACTFPSELARITLRFTLDHDADVRHLLLDYDLDILPVYIKFARHARLTLPIEEVAVEEVGRWVDDRLIDFVRVHLQMQFAEPYQREMMVCDPVANVRFPKNFARMTLKHEGQTYYFISDETCWEFEKQHGIG